MTVLESPDHGPQLCAYMNFSDPPQCSGPDVVGWDWKAVKHDAKGGVRWGDYRVVGTWDSERFHLTEPAHPARRIETPATKWDATTPCPEPPGGWRLVDPDKVSSAAMEQAFSRARGAKGYAGSWVKGYDGSTQGKYVSNPKQVVLNFKFTGDLAAREAWIRKVWGGALCVSKADYSQSKLLTVQQRIHKEIKGAHSSYPDTMDNRLHVGVWVLTDELRREVDEKYGKGVVVLWSLLTPL